MFVFIKFIMELDFITRILPEYKITDIYNKLSKILSLIGANMNNNKLTYIASRPIMIGISHANQLILKMTKQQTKSQFPN